MGVQGCCNKFMKFFLAFLNFLVLAAGAIAIGLGAWALASEYGAEEMKAVTGSGLYKGGCIVLIVGGSIIVVLALLGFLGAVLENRVLLGIYFVIMILILILFVVGASLGFFFRDTLEEKIGKAMEETLIKQYSVSYSTNDENKLVTDVWDKLQKELKCCGVSGGLNSSTSWFLYQKTEWFMNSNKTVYVPASCCNPNINKVNLDQCQKLNTDTNSFKPIKTDLSLVRTENDALYSTGCLDSLIDKLKPHILAIAGIALAVIIVMFLAIIFSVCICMEIGRNKHKV
ncbi:CD82 antigen-like [Physella acuta]|uniref:CD82 antigen-like n=1 Tax=Physella acuta TaxID=109671 RepID=UPI0027DC898C|nr:CD82 antigen-like [Physella acuta]XP_059174072.1 CD82 antigen-like [Physella acuta]XP_059174073.1 CD82 antigen-like [Physella acuta]XP_059174074.1 CD82 antigen-like [Physella acuta]XP_059174075.1 CD82 antigen-like [Physella acuta]XP_059174076.1 CD82 antigen-like [Physella acuta]